MSGRILKHDAIHSHTAWRFSTPERAIGLRIQTSMQVIVAKKMSNQFLGHQQGMQAVATVVKALVVMETKGFWVLNVSIFFFVSFIIEFSEFH